MNLQVLLMSKAADIHEEENSIQVKELRKRARQAAGVVPTWAAGARGGCAALSPVKEVCVFYGDMHPGRQSRIGLPCHFVDDWPTSLKSTAVAAMAISRHELPRPTWLAEFQWGWQIPRLTSGKLSGMSARHSHRLGFRSKWCQSWKFEASKILVSLK